MKYLLSILIIITTYSNIESAVIVFNSESKITIEEFKNYSENDTLKLNKGQKWKVVKEMMVYIDYMKSDVNNFDGSSLEEFKALSTDLLINIDLLTANCTMIGDAHDQLHLWLVPFIVQVNKFTATESIVDFKNKHLELKNSFEEFDRFFE